MISDTKISMPKEKDLAGTIILDDSLNYIVIVRGTASGKWGLPKGHVEQGESHISAAIRETREETGLNIKLLVEVLPCILSKRAKLFLMVLPKQAEQVFKIIDSAEISDVKWLSIEDLPNLHGKNRMLTGIYNRMSHIKDKIKKNRMNYYWSQLHESTEIVNNFIINKKLCDSIIPHLDKSVDDIISIIQEEYNGLYYEAELRSAIITARRALLKVNNDLPEMVPEAGVASTGDVQASQPHKPRAKNKPQYHTNKYRFGGDNTDKYVLADKIDAHTKMGLLRILHNINQKYIDLII